MKNKQNCKKLLYALLALFLLVISIMGGRGIFPAFADISGYTSTLTDLQKDGDFNITDYPDNSNNYSIQVIQIAESTDGELFVYTYQPCQKTTYLIATQINMSLTDKLGVEVKPDTQLTDNDKPKLYSLMLVSMDGVFGKYKVNDFIVSSEAVRYYNVVSIFRKYNKDYDGETGNDNDIKSKYVKVGKLYEFKTVDGSVSCSCKNVDTVEIKNPYVDFLSYYSGMTWASFLGLAPDNYTDVHYIAFSTDKQIDTLKEADVTYTTQSYHIKPFGAGTDYGEKSDPQYITLTGEMGGSTSGGFLADKYTWKSIQRTADFIKSTGMDSGNYAYDNIKDTEFVLVFYTTPFSRKQVSSLMQGHSYEYNGTKVSDSAILRLMFESNGKTYNLGVLSDQLEGDDTPGNGVKPMGFWAYIWRCIVRLFNGTATLGEQIVAVIALFIVLLFLPILITVLSFVFPAFGAVVKKILKGIWTGIKYLFIGIWYVISSPVRLIILIVHKCRG